MAQIQNIKLANGTEMPMQSFGVFQIPAGKTERVVLEAVSTGYRLLDTAYSYQNEAEVGRAVQTAIVDGLVRRESFSSLPRPIQMGYEKTLAAFYESLRKLHLDYLDLYLIHMSFGDYYGLWRALEELYAQGLIRSIGVCNFDSATMIFFQTKKKHYFFDLIVHFIDYGPDPPAFCIFLIQMSAI